MQLITDEIKDYLAHASGIRKMYEAGLARRRQ